jgi:isoleucyl-tRNA synthetase
LAALNTQLTPELVQEGLARDVIRLVQNARKNAELEVSDTIVLSLETQGELKEALEAHRSTVKNEVLAETVSFDALPNARYREEAEVEGTPLVIGLEKAQRTVETA